MSITYTYTASVKVGNNTTSFSIAKTADGEYVFDDAIAANQTNKLIAGVLDVSQIKMLYLYSDQDCTLETNDSGSPVDTISLDAGCPIVWVHGSGVACPLTTDVTAFYVTNTTAITRLIIRAQVDLTV